MIRLYLQTALRNSFIFEVEIDVKYDTAPKRACDGYAACYRPLQSSDKSVSTLIPFFRILTVFSDLVLRGLAQKKTAGDSKSASGCKNHSTVFFNKYLTDLQGCQGYINMANLYSSGAVRSTG